MPRPRSAHPATAMCSASLGTSEMMLASAHDQVAAQRRSATRSVRSAYALSPPKAPRNQNTWLYPAPTQRSAKSSSAARQRPERMAAFIRALARDTAGCRRASISMIGRPAARNTAYDPACPAAVKKPTISAAYIHDQPRACIAMARKLNMASEEMGTPTAIKKKPPPRNATDGTQAVVTLSRPIGLTLKSAALHLKNKVRDRCRFSGGCRCRASHRIFNAAAHAPATQNLLEDPRQPANPHSACRPT